MRYIVAIIVCLSLGAAMFFAWHTRDAAPLVCRVVFGDTSTSEILVGRRGSELLIYRNGSINSTPESYPLIDGKLGADCEVPPFNYGKATFTLTGCYEHIATEPAPRHGLMLHGTVADGDLVFKQYCDVGLRLPSEPLEMTHFDGPLTVGIQTYDWRPIPLKFTIGGEPTDVRVTIGTTDQSLGCWATLETGANGVSNFDDGVRPIATIEFPTTDPNKPIIKKYELSEFC